MSFINIPLKNLRNALWNYKEDDKKKDLLLEENIKNNGFLVNLIVREIADGIYRVVNGNHRLYALRKLYDGDHEVTCYNLGKVSEAKGLLSAIETNETYFLRDELKFAETLDELKNSFDVSDLMSTLPFSKKEFDMFERISQEDFLLDNTQDTKNEEQSTNIDFDLDEVAVVKGKGANENKVIRLYADKETIDKLNKCIDKYSEYFNKNKKTKVSNDVIIGSITKMLKLYLDEA
jgi:ribosomal protein S8